jgi:hypothetical protein
MFLGLGSFLVATLLSGIVEMWRGLHTIDYLYSVGLPWGFAYIGGFVRPHLDFVRMLYDIAFFLLVAAVSLWTRGRLKP